MPTLGEVSILAAQCPGRAMPVCASANSGAVIGRGYAILDSGFVKLSGFSAWLAWACVHIAFLPAPGNRWRVWTQTLWSYFTRQRSSQLIVEPRSGQVPGQLPSQSAGEHSKAYETAHQ